MPGDATAQAALGYLHANCGNCHGGPAPEHGLDYWQRVGATDVTLAATWTTSVCGCSVWTQTLPSGELADLRIAPHHPELSVSLIRMQTRAATDAMPPIGTEVLDPDGIAAVSELDRVPPGGRERMPARVSLALSRASEGQRSTSGASVATRCSGSASVRTRK